MRIDVTTLRELSSRCPPGTLDTLAADLCVGRDSLDWCSRLFMAVRTMLRKLKPGPGRSP